MTGFSGDLRQALRAFRRSPGIAAAAMLSEVGFFLAAGSIAGLPAAYALARAVQSILFGVRAADLPIFAAGILLLAGVALAAAFPPALEAARSNAMEALRGE